MVPAWASSLRTSLGTLASVSDAPVRCRCVLVGVWPCHGPIVAAASRPRREGRPSPVFPNETVARSTRQCTPGAGASRTLAEGGEPAAFLRVQAQPTRHLDRHIAQVKSPLGFRPGVEAGLRLLHDVSFF